MAKLRGSRKTDAGWHTNSERKLPAHPQCPPTSAMNILRGQPSRLGMPHFCKVQPILQSSAGRMMLGVSARAVATQQMEPAQVSSSTAQGQHMDELPVVELPPPTDMKIKTAEFVKSSPKLSMCPPPTLPEFAVIGRSNVGKSSLINMLTGRKALAMVSKTPGKTIHINHFIINSSWYLVDLPGYGYAKRAKEKRLEWGSFTRDYFLKRETLANVLLLIDASIPPTEIDLSCSSWLAESQVPFSLVFTKTDKRKKGLPKPAQNIAAFKAAVLKDWEYLPYSLQTSSQDGTGRQELAAYIASLREMFLRGDLQR